MIGNLVTFVKLFVFRFVWAGQKHFAMYDSNITLWPAYIAVATNAG